jgi:cyclomaltodextrinase / maltogenic alpha-amylase / neopullulanase
MPVDTPSWVREAVFYQIFPDRFAASSRVRKPGPMEPWGAPPTTHGYKGGDLLGVVERLDELDELGITALYLTPIFASASNHRYHAYDYLAVDPMLGGEAAFRELLDAAHARGMRVVLDGVFNHCGRGFWPFHHVAESGGASPYRDWFYLDPEVLAGRRGIDPYPGLDQEAEQRRLESTGMSAGEASRRVLGFEGWWGLPALPKLNTNHPGAREYLLGVAEHWLRFGIDGWRLDVAEEIDGEYWAEFRARCRAVNPDAYLVAEIWHPKPEWLTGRHFDALMNYPLAEAIIGYAGGPSLDRAVANEHEEFGRSVFPRDAASFGAELGRLMALYDPNVVAVMLDLLGSHDTPRVRTVMGGDLDAVRLATLLQMTLPGAPCIYYGDEIGIEGHQDPGCRPAMPAEPVSGERAALRAFIRDLIALRRGHRALRDGELRVSATAGDAIAFVRTHGAEVFVVAANAGVAAAGLSMDLPGAAGRPETASLTGWPAGPERIATWTGPGRLEVRLPPRSGLVVRLHRATG